MLGWPWPALRGHVRLRTRALQNLSSPTRVKINLPEVPIPAKNQKKAAEWNPPNRQADLGTHCSNHMVVVWLQQLEPG